MFGFGRSKKVEVADVVIPVPSADNYVLTDTEQTALDCLVVDNEGFVAIGDVTHELLHQQPQYITAYMDGRKEGSPVLIDGLRVNIETSSYHEYRIHRDDVLEFVARVRAWRNR